MLPWSAGDEETRTREGEMGAGLDLLLGLGFLQPTMAGAAGGSAAQKRRPYEKTAFDEPLSFAAATETTASATTMRACLRRRRLSHDVDDGGDGVVPAPQASTLKPASSTARWPAHATSPTKLGSFRGVVFQVPSTTPRTNSDLAAADGQGMAHAVATRAPPLMQRDNPCCPAAGGLFVGSSRPPVPVAAGLIAAARSSHDDSTAPMTIIYAGSVRAYGGVTMEHAEKILAVVAKEAHAAGIGTLPVVEEAEQQLELVSAPASTGGAAQMTMQWGWGLAHDVNDSRKRTASLARFLDKRKQRAESSAATMHHPPRREEWFPAQIMEAPPAATVSARTNSSLGGMDRRPRAFQDHPKRMKKANHAEESVSTELKI